MVTLPGQQVHDKAPPDVGPRTAQVFEHVGVQVARLFECVRQHAESDGVEVADGRVRLS